MCNPGPGVVIGLSLFIFFGFCFSLLKCDKRSEFFNRFFMHILSYNPTKEKTAFEFYILCKGNNSGRPMVAPLPNSFTCICTSQEEKDFYFWLCFGLWKGKAFEPYLTGSVIPFICIKEVLTLLQVQADYINRPAWVATVEKLKQLEAHESNLRRQLQLMQSLKVALVRQQIKP